MNYQRFLLLQSRVNKINIQLDFSVVRGLEYYTGTIFEVNLFLKMPQMIKRLTKKLKLDQLVAARRYDNLVSRFTNQSCPCNGSFIWVDRLCIILIQKKDFKDKDNSTQ